MIFFCIKIRGKAKKIIINKKRLLHVGMQHSLDFTYYGDFNIINILKGTLPFSTFQIRDCV